MLRTILQVLPVLAFSYAGQILMKRGVNSVGLSGGWASIWAHPLPILISFLTNWYVLAGFVSAGVGAVLYLFVLSQSDYTAIFPIMGALVFVALPLIGKIFLNENPTWGRVVGTIIITAGMLIVARS
jgi:drug/metabolite transporter (DMT)-like permease